VFQSFKTKNKGDMEDSKINLRLLSWTCNVGRQAGRKREGEMRYIQEERQPAKNTTEVGEKSEGVRNSLAAGACNAVIEHENQHEMPVQETRKGTSEMEKFEDLSGVPNSIEKRSWGGRKKSRPNCVSYLRSRPKLSRLTNKQ